MSFSNDQGEYIINAYINEKKSLAMIAEEFGTYVNKIRRFLNKRGVEIRSISESQKIALDTGRNEHPTKGRKRSKEEKGKIAVGVAKSWSELSEDKLDKIKDAARERWNNMSDTDKENISQAAKRGMREASISGSKMEKFIQQELEDNDIPVIFHKKGLVENSNLEVDIFLPSYNIAIEIDGPTHFFPIFGEDRLQKTMESDRTKIGLLLANKINILRVKHISKNASLAKAKKIVEYIVGFLETLDINKAKFKEVEV